MVKTGDFQLCQQCPVMNALDLNHMRALYQARQQNSLPSAPDACAFSTNFTVPIVPASDSPDLTTVQLNRFNWYLHSLPILNGSLPTRSEYHVESLFTVADGLGARGTLHDAAGYNQKKLVIFDQSSCQTRLFVGAFCSPLQHSNTASVRNIHACNAEEENWAAMHEKISPLGPMTQENLLENHKLCKESEMHEDTEEINALLDSDDNDTGDYDGEYENDEVMSSGRSPFITEGIYEKDGQDDSVEEVANPSCLSKRQKLLDGGYRKFSFGNVPDFVDDADSSCAHGMNLDKDTSYTRKLSRKRKIRDILRILKGIVPGVKRNDPLLIIDEAISYLKYLKHEAGALGFSYP